MTGTTPRTAQTFPDGRYRMIVLNGGSSSGKSSISRCMQEILDRDDWLRFSIDDLVDALPPRLTEVGEPGIGFGSGGEVTVGGRFRAAEASWLTGLAAMARAGARLIVDDVFLSGGGSQQRMADRFGDLPVLWVGVRCPAEIATERERSRGDRPAGMAARQAEAVHVGVHYDLEVDSGRRSASECAQQIAAVVAAEPAR